MANQQPKRREPRQESPLSAALQVLGVAILLAAAVTLYVRHAHQRKDLEDRVSEARLTARGDNPSDLRRALGQLEEALALDGKDAAALSLAASLEAERLLTHHEEDARSRATELSGRAADVDAQTAERFSTEALLALERGEGQRAREILRPLLDAGANHPLVLYAASLASRDAGNLSDAHAQLLGAMEGARGQPRFPLAYAASAVDEGRLEPAADVLERTLIRNEGHLGSLLLAGLVGAYRGRVGPEARALVAQLQSRGGEALSPALRAQLHALEAHAALGAGDTALALKAAEQGLASDPRSVHAAVARAQALTREGSDRAQTAWLEAAALRPQAPFFYLEGTRALLGAGNTDGARRVLEAWTAAFEPLRVKGEDGSNLVPALDRDDRYWIAQAQLAEATAKPASALEHYERAVSAKGLHQADALVGKGRLLLARQDWDGAKLALAQVAPEDGSGTLPEAYRAMGELLFHQGELQRGAAHFGYALGRLKQQGAPAGQLETLRQDVGERLRALKQPALSKAWLEETRQLL